jgi:hypothetical protein
MHIFWSGMWDIPNSEKVQSPESVCCGRRWVPQTVLVTLEHLVPQTVLVTLEHLALRNGLRRDVTRDTHHYSRLGRRITHWRGQKGSGGSDSEDSEKTAWGALRCAVWHETRIHCSGGTNIAHCHIRWNVFSGRERIQGTYGTSTHHDFATLRRRPRGTHPTCSGPLTGLGPNLILRYKIAL